MWLSLSLLNLWTRADFSRLLPLSEYWGHQFEFLDLLGTCWQAKWLSNAVTSLSNRCLNALEEGHINLINPTLTQWICPLAPVPDCGHTWKLPGVKSASLTKSICLLDFPWLNMGINMGINRSAVVQNGYIAAGNQTLRFTERVHECEIKQ